jgi:signal transduction histidine kinase
VVTVERHKLLQILFNLLENAKHACDSSGSPQKQVTIRIRQERNHARVAVIDNGVGIPAEHMPKIFAQDFSTRKGGHGFGLHSSLLAVQELGGSLLAHSAGLGQGASFTLDIPIAGPEDRNGTAQPTGAALAW